MGAQRIRNRRDAVVYRVRDGATRDPASAYLQYRQCAADDDTDRPRTGAGTGTGAGTTMSTSGCGPVAACAYELCAVSVRRGAGGRWSLVR